MLVAVIAQFKWINNAELRVFANGQEASSYCFQNITCSHLEKASGARILKEFQMTVGLKV
jgi:hypothetical protein